MKSFGLLLVASLCAFAGCASDEAGLSFESARAAEAGDRPSTVSARAPDAGAGADGSSALVAPAEPLEVSVPRCGPPPHHPVVLRARDIQAQAGREQGGVTITFKHCPGQRFMTGRDGRAVVPVTLGAETWIRFEAPGYLPWMVGEMPIGADLPPSGVVGTLVPRSLAATVTPGYQAESPLVFVQVQAGRATASDACRAREGVLLGVKDHPEATVLYRATGSNGSYQRGLGTSAEGVAIVAGLAPDSGPIELVAQKMGCDYTLSYGDANSPALVPILRTPISAGVVTYQSINPTRP